MNPERWLEFLALLAFLGFVGLGYAATHARRLWGIDVAAAGLRGRGVRAAAVFTASGRAMPLVAVSAVIAAIVFASHERVLPAMTVFGVQVLSQTGNEVCKRLFVRKRPERRIGREEPGFSYPSGHATTATVFYGSWLLFVLLSDLPAYAKLLLAALLLFWIAGIDWSRLALGAHYPTDVAGGTLFGLAWMCACAAAMLHSPAFAVVPSGR